MTGARPLWIEAHHLVFSYLGARHSRDINYHLTEKPRQGRLQFFRSLNTEPVYCIERSHLLDYLTFLEERMSPILSKHSPLFWMFLYRRIKPSLSNLHDNKTDELTVHLVRSIAGLAIVKYANLSITNDIRQHSELTLGTVWGGYLDRALQQVHATDLVEQMRKDLEANDAYSPASFTATDYRDIFTVEGLCYEYWLCTARLRSIGKGLQLNFEREGGVFAYEADLDLDEAITRYDNRLTSAKYFSTMIGVVNEVHGREESIGCLLLLTHNVAGVDMLPALKPLGLDVAAFGNDASTNFVPLFMSFDNFMDAHNYLTKEFRNRWGFDLRDLLLVLWALGNIALIPNRYIEQKDKQPLGTYFLRLLKRGYTICSVDGAPTYEGIRERLNTWLKLDQDATERAISKVDEVFEWISLSKDKQSAISLWSGGPRPIIIPYGDIIVIDVAGISEFLRRVFTGVRDDGTIRGLEFEETVRSTIRASLPNGFEVGPRKIKEGGTLKDEIDLLLRKGETVYVCECFSMWRPLDIEIGAPERISNRLAQVDEKIDQAHETCDYLQKKRVGTNYDYSAVREFVPIVVSPFIEWLPSTSKRYWIDDCTPRVMSLDELEQFVISR